MTIATTGNLVSVHYRGTLEDGTEFDNSYSRGEPISFTVGAGQMISGFDTAVNGMTAGEKKDVTLNPSDAYGESNPEAVQSFPRTSFPEELKVEVGTPVEARTPEGQPVRAFISGFDGEDVQVDFNHPLAGKTLNFEIELVDVTNESA